MIHPNRFHRRFKYGMIAEKKAVRATRLPYRTSGLEISVSVTHSNRPTLAMSVPGAHTQLGGAVDRTGGEKRDTRNDSRSHNTTRASTTARSARRNRRHCFFRMKYPMPTKGMMSASRPTRARKTMTTGFGRWSKPWITSTVMASDRLFKVVARRKPKTVATTATMRRSRSVGCRTIFRSAGSSIITPRSSTVVANFGSSWLTVGGHHRRDSLPWEAES